MTSLSIDPRRWRMLFADNIQVTAEFMAARGTLTADDFQQLVSYLDEAKLMAAAWYRAGNPVRVEVEAPALPRDSESIDLPKRRGGWPKGRSRKRNNPAGAMQ